MHIPIGLDRRRIAAPVAEPNLSVAACLAARVPPGRDSRADEATLARARAKLGRLALAAVGPARSHVTTSTTRAGRCRLLLERLSK